MLHPTAGQDTVVPATTDTTTPAAVTTTTTGEDYSVYNVGDEFKGVKIARIVLQYSDAIVFTTATGGIYFYHQCGARGDAALTEFYRCSTKSAGKLKQAYGRQVNNLLGSAIAEALSVPDENDVKPAFNGVDQFIDQHGPIVHIFGYGDGWVVFFDPAGELVCEYATVTESTAPLLSEFYRLQQEAKSSLLPEENAALSKILGTELSIALQQVPAPAIDTAFSASRDFIKLRNESRMRAWYIGSSLSVALIFGLIAWIAIRNDQGLLLGTIGGIIGATISVLQRSATLEIKRFLPTSQVVLQGTVRVTLGLLFGLLIVAASRTNVALGTFAASANSLFLAGVAAGFSERFVPDLLTKITTDGNSKTTTSGAAGS